MSLPFQGIRTFAKCQHSQQPQTEFVVVGLPVDTAATNRSGSRHGPGAIRNASAMLSDGVCEQWPGLVSANITDLGDIDISTGNTNSALQEIQTVMQQLQNADLHVISLGGDHLVTLAILRAMHERYPQLACLHLDAHCDVSVKTDQPHQGHGAWLYKSITEGLLNPNHVISVGVRAPAWPENKQWFLNQGGIVISARQAQKYSAASMADIIKAKIGNMPCYFTLDVDCLDPVHAPGTGMPVIGGISSMWVEELIDALAELNFVGMDCVEVIPAYDHSEITSLAAASFCWRYISQRIYLRIKDLTSGQ